MPMSNKFARLFGALSLSLSGAVFCVVGVYSPIAWPAQCVLSTPEFAGMERRLIGLQDEHGNVIRFRVRVADSPGERSAGYQHICPEVIAASSVLFVYSEPRTVSFHMFNVHADLDIAFISDSGELVSIQRMEPQQSGDPDASFYGPDREVRYALEAPAGFFERHGLEQGSARLLFE